MTLNLVAPPVDQHERDQLRTDLDRSFFVEAGAGTGKTTTLVLRIVALVAADRVRMDRLVAITFTEAAAAELKERVRRHLEESVLTEEWSEVERERLARAASEVDLAAVSTIHAFAGSLLRVYPIEARLPPAFSTWDDVQSRIDFEERFRAWLYDEVPTAAPEGQPRREAIRRALLLGMTLDHLRALARALQDHADLLTPTTCWPAPDPPNALEVANRVGQGVQSLERRVHLAKNGEDDKLVREIRRLAFPARRLAEARDETDALAALQDVGSIKTSVGAQKDWVTGPDRLNPVPEIKDILRFAKADVEETLEAHRRLALSALLAHARDFTATYARERREAGVATFHDLLTWARDLLRDNLDVRARAQRQFTCIFVDEFQDTDPLQAEIAWLLAADPDLPPPSAWRDAPIVPGKLFVVGDPKQSIYRFRRADIAMYHQICQRAPAEEKMSLRQNFRSVGPILAWVNHHFDRDMRGEDGVQARYERLHPSGIEQEEGGVYAIGGVVEGKAATVHAREAEAVAATARTAVERGWRVRDRTTGRWRPAQYSDVCILLPTRTNAGGLEDALERFAVPYRLEGGSLVLATPEVRDLLSCLRAIADPSDQVALVAALRSSAYACSDVDLLEWVERGAHLNYDVEHGERDGLVAEAMVSLRSFHRARADRSTAATIDAFVRDRMLAVGAFGQPRPREAWRRLRYVVAQARLLTSAGRSSLRALVDWLDDLGRGQYRDPESPLPETDEDAVRLMTVHAAKGLEFPIVLMTGLGSPHHPRSETVRVLADWETGNLEIRVGDFSTERFEVVEEREKRLAEAEQVRLHYVAATRARDHLVLILYHADPKSPAARILGHLDGTDGQLCRQLEPDFSPPALRHQNSTEVDVAAPEGHALRERAWQDARAELVKRSSASLVVTPTELARRARATANSGTDRTSQRPPAVSRTTPGLFPLPTGEGEGEGRTRFATSIEFQNSAGGTNLLFDDEEVESGDFDPDVTTAAMDSTGAAALGRAVHAALAAIEAGSSETEALLSVTRDRRLGDRAREVERLVEAVRGSPAYRRAIAMPRHWYEVPVGVEIDGTVLEGRIDLLWERPDGTLGILDVKTDRVELSTLMARVDAYRAQVGAYALAIQEVTQKRVTSVELVFAALEGYVVAFDDIQSLVEEARGLVARG